MGFFDYLLFGALINSLRNSGRSNNTHSSFSNDSYDRGAQTDTFLEMIGFDKADIRRIKAQEQRTRGLQTLTELGIE